MVRQDISVNGSYGEVETTDHLTNKVVYSFENLEYIEGLNNHDYCHGQITVSPDFRKKLDDPSGFHLYIPYCPIYRSLRMRFCIEHSNGSSEYLINPYDNSEWFMVYPDYETISLSNYTLMLSEFRLLNESGYFNMIFREGYLNVYSGAETDFVINAALPQNEVFLLKAFAGSLYQHPTTGVGLIEFLHGNFENTGLAQKLQNEFTNDKMIINNAYMDSNTGELYLDVKEKNG